MVRLIIKGEITMAFVSMAEISRPLSEPKLTVRYTGMCSVNRAVAGDFDSVEAEICFESKTFRLRVGEGLPKKLRDGANFSIPKAAYQAILDGVDVKMVMPLTKGNDGWWYAKY